MMYDVAVVGAGPSGLSAALALGRFGLNVVLIDSKTEIEPYPKARGMTTRTMELFRAWGVYDEMRTHEFPGHAARFTWLERFGGPVLAHVKANDVGKTPHSPVGRGLLGQDKVEHVLLNACQSHPHITCLLGQAATYEAQDAQSVTVKVGQDTVKAQYLIGADGAHSAIREAVGIEMVGPGMLGDMCSVYCDMDLDAYFPEGHSVVAMIADKRLVGRMLLWNQGHGWLFVENSIQDRAQQTPEYCKARIRETLGLPDLEIDIRAINFWRMTAQVAETFQSERVFLVGDAAHRVPPTGGFGMNLGINDAHNLAWKLAFVLQGHASPKLLDTYTPERAPFARYICEWSGRNAARLGKVKVAIEEEDWDTFRALLDDMQSHLNVMGLDLGFHYESDAIAKEDTPAPEMADEVYIPTTYPGFRAPHIWIGDKSLLDYCEKTYVLLTGDAPHWVTWQAELSFPCTHLINAEALEACGLPATGALLIRPDGHVAWRCADQESTNKLFNSILD